MSTKRVVAVGSLGAAVVASTMVSAQADPLPSRSDLTRRVVSRSVLLGSDGEVLGGVLNGRFVGPAAVVGGIGSGMTYDVYSATGLVGRARGSAAIPNTDVCPETTFVTLTPRRARTVSATHGKASQPRRVRPVRLDSATRRGMVRLLRAQGITSPPAAKQVIRVDVDADGRSEVVVKAERLKYENGYLSPDARAGDYSFVAVFRAGRLVKTLGANFFPRAKPFSAPLSFSIAAIADFNGDSGFEIGVFSHYYEGSSTELYSASRSGIRHVFSAGCGS